MKKNIPLILIFLVSVFTISCSSEDEPAVYSEIDLGPNIGWAFYSETERPWDEAFPGLFPPEYKHPDWRIVNSVDEFYNLPAGYIPKGHGGVVELYAHYFDDCSLLIVRQQFAVTNPYKMIVKNKMYDRGNNKYLLLFDIYYAQAVPVPEVAYVRFAGISLFFIEKMPANPSITIKECFYDDYSNLYKLTQ